MAVRLVVDDYAYPVGLEPPYVARPEGGFKPAVLNAAARGLSELRSRIVQTPGTPLGVSSGGGAGKGTGKRKGGGKMGGKGGGASGTNNLYHTPVLHVDEFGLTSDKYLPLNGSVGSLPLKLSFAPMAPARHRLMGHFSHALESQKELGFAETDIDDVRRLISDTSV